MEQSTNVLSRRQTLPRRRKMRNRLHNTRGCHEKSNDGIYDSLPSFFVFVSSISSFFLYNIFFSIIVLFRRIKSLIPLSTERPASTSRPPPHRFYLTSDLLPPSLLLRSENISWARFVETKQRNGH
ncbi:hypothetical protein BJ508DRAFT_7324 [Ascobolus immersus RN42]|uniref:Transmembrane protein n=1 Tax=Ascobolus immersus RN42 TaxID=1160509 RepID=A0A3N4IUS2_ASCIM|nr:hypothetical protein BJ508DRAFT_7324 [Ascobolus immersus RN42]